MNKHQTALDWIFKMPFNRRFKLNPEQREIMLDVILGQIVLPTSPQAGEKYGYYYDCGLNMECISKNKLQ